MVHIGVITYLLTFTNFLGHPTAFIIAVGNQSSSFRGISCVSENHTPPNPKLNDFAHIPWEDTPNFPKPPQMKEIPSWTVGETSRGVLQGYEILDKPNHLFQNKTSPFLVKMEPPTPFSYTMESYFQDDFWPYILKNWPMDAERKKAPKAVGGSKNKQRSHSP